LLHVCHYRFCYRLTFRRISQDTQQFVRFANGLMNETNSLVASVMEKLPEIRAIQVQQKDGATWNSLTDDRRTEVIT
jgi:ubiquitin conjugation factor E4 B